MEWHMYQIYHGWKNWLFPRKNQSKQINEVFVSRYAVCHSCRLNSRRFRIWWRPDEHCVKCGCTLVTKLRCLECACPKELWSSIDNLDELMNLK